MNYFNFINNINKLITKNGSKKDFALSIGVNYDTVRRWGLGEFLPGGTELIKIAETYNISIDWLLTGKEADDPLISDWAPETQEACRTVKKIIESGDKTTALALQMNLNAFAQSIDRYDDNQTLKKDVEKLKKAINQLEKMNTLETPTGIDPGALPNTGGRGTLYTPDSPGSTLVQESPAKFEKKPSTK